MNTSLLVAKNLEGFDSMIKAILPSQDFIAGSSWKESFEELLNSDYSLIILTKDNINSPWMMFEAGVLSKSNQKYYQNRICPIIFGRNESDVEAPLSYFNVLNFSQQGRQGLHSLLEDVYERLKSSLRKEVKSSSLYIEETWQELETDIDAIIKANKNAHPSRNRNNVRTLKNLYMNLSKEQLFKWSNNKNMTVRQLPVLLKEYVDYKLEDENYKIPNPVFETTTVVINSTRISIFFVFTDGKAVLLFDRKSPNIQIDNERYDMFGGVEFDSTSFIKKIGKNNEFLDLKIENIDYMSGMAIEDNIDKNMQGETVIMIGYVIYVKEINKNVETEENNVKLLDIEILKNIKNITSKAALAKEFFLEKR